MSGLNKVMLIGRLGKDPEVRALQSGAKVASFSLATSENWTDKQSGEKREKTDWHQVVVFNEHLVKVVEGYARKGSQVYVEGKLQTRKWQDQSGTDRYVTEVVLQSFGGAITLLGDPRDKSGDDGARGEDRSYSAHRAAPQDDHRQDRRQDARGNTTPANAYDFDDEIPF